MMGVGRQAELGCVGGHWGGGGGLVSVESSV
jgi:hypothetical protein